MPTSLSLQDLRRGEKLHLRNQQQQKQNDDYGYYHQQQQQQYIHHEQIEFIDDFDDNEFVEEDIIEQDLINANDEDVGSSQDVDIEGVINMSIPPTTHDIRNVPIDDHYGIDIGSEQVVVESVDVDDEEHAQEELTQHQQIGFHQKEKAQKDCNKIIEIVPRREDKIEENIREEGTSQQLFHQSFDDVPLFEHSQIGLNEFSTEFLALTRKHRLQPKARAILLDLLRQAMPKENCCPLTVTNMRKMVAKDGRMHWFGTALGSSLPSTSKTIARPQHAQMVLSQSSSKMPSTSQNLPSSEYQLDGEYLEEEIIVDDRNVNVIKQQQPRHYSVNDPSLLPRIVETINHLSNEIAYLRSQIESQSNGNIFGTVRKLNKRVTDARFGLHIYNEHNKKVPLSQLTNEEIKNTVKISRMNGNRLIYGMNDITELVLEKVDISAYIHNPSLCGRIVADALFSPEYLADKHILGEGQISSRTRLETLPPEMTELFYDTLRKLGISRIVDEDQEHWLYLARDGVNQRARDLKANRKRKFYIDDQPLFGDE